MECCHANFRASIPSCAGVLHSRGAGLLPSCASSGQDLTGNHTDSVGLDRDGSLGNRLWIRSGAQDCRSSQQGASAFNSIDPIQSLASSKPRPCCERCIGRMLGASSTRERRASIYRPHVLRRRRIIAPYVETHCRLVLFGRPKEPLRVRVL